MKVVSTQEGFYDNVYREVGEVFALVGDVNDKGDDPAFPYPFRAKNYTPKKDAKGKVIEDEFDESDRLDKAGNPIHVDFAEDIGAQLIKRGPKKGETARVGWMLKVPDETPTGLYPLGIDFWSGVQLPQAVKRQFGPTDKRATGAIRSAA